jgi:hypothetical protein
MEGLRKHVSTHRLHLVEALPDRGPELGLQRCAPLMEAEPRLAGEPTRAPSGSWWRHLLFHHESGATEFSSARINFVQLLCFEWSDRLYLKALPGVRIRNEGR